MRKVAAQLRTNGKGLPPGVYLVDLPDGMAPGTTLDVELCDADFLVRAAEKGQGGDAQTGGGGGPNLSGAAEKIAPVIASIATRFL